jgi:hypothetical protein
MFLGMAQYYRDRWTRYNEILVPIAPVSFVGGCNHTKVTKAKITKKRAWYWDKIHQKAFDNMKATISKDVSLIYPDYLKECEMTLMPFLNNLLQL